ncbi:glycosyltransferase family 39 protein [Desulfovibrio sp. TomC]|uniref:glycosyltransferase family 39 protein n=1 Tax=Desulfovibrio sp. TomC TaxID=1562888 RepID=UPI00057498B2|nr:glycosyltransferase family 39 protein [Desulfovibrio sp. TomC]KHK00874.1 putative inner membrane protein [Desulfovibrio sp. TomC]
MPSPSEPSRRVFRLLLGGIILAAALLRCWDIDVPQLWEDDYLNLDRAMLAPARLIESQLYLGPVDTIYDFQPPLTYLINHLALGLSNTVLAARVPSLATGLLTVLGLGLLGAACAGRRAGLAAAALCAGALFPVEISRAIKPYALFLCTLVYSLYFLVRCVRPGRRPLHPAGYVVATAAMLWTAFQGVPVLAAQGLGVGLLYLRRYGIFAGPGRTVRLTWIAAAMAAAGCLWLPIAPGLFFINTFLNNPSVPYWTGLTPRFFADILAGFFYLNFDYGPAAVAVMASLLLLGLRQAWTGPTALVALAALVPSLAILTSQSDLRPLVSWRHLITVLPALCILCGSGASWLGGLAGRQLPDRVRGLAALTLTGAACALVLAAPLTRLDDFYQRTLSNDRDLFRFLSRTPGPETALVFTGYQRNAKAFAARWHLPGLPAGPGNFAAPGYQRLRSVDLFEAHSERRRAMPRGALLASWGTGGIHARVGLAGLPSRAPLLLAPDLSGRARYFDDFRDWRAYNDAFSLDNWAVDSDVGLMRPARYEQPATAVWRFDLPPGAAAGSVTARITAVLYKRHPTIPADAVLSIAASTDGKTYTPVARLGHENFLTDDGSPRLVPRRFFEEIPFYQGRSREVETTIDLTPYAAAGSLWLRVTYAPGTREGYLNLAGLEVTGQGLDTRTATDQLPFYAANLARNCRAPAYHSGLTLLGQAAYVFALPDHPELARSLPGGEVIGPPAALAAFLADHPGLAPAYVLPDAAGQPAVAVFDPVLTPEAGGVALSDASPQAEVEQPDKAPLPVSALTLAGRINAPVLTLGNEPVPVLVSAPAGSVLRLTPRGRGTLYFSPDFDPPDFSDSPNAHSQNMAVSTSYPDYSGGVTCLPGTDCRFEYVFVSAYPITALRIMAYPRLYGDKDGYRACTVSYATDGQTFHTLLDARNTVPDTWSLMFLRRHTELRLPRPTTQVTVRFSLRADFAAEFWSPTRPIDRMVIEADLDARQFPGLTVPPGNSRLTLSGNAGNAFRVWFSERAPGLERVWPGQ